MPGARLKLEAARVADRCETVAGDFFKSVPGGGDAYIMKWIIHDWNDEKAITILRNCRTQMPQNGKLIVVDCVVPETDEPDWFETGNRSYTTYRTYSFLRLTTACPRMAVPTQQLN